MNGRGRYSIRVEGAKYGASFGTALAIAISYTTNHSILWAIVHGIFSWLYVIYFALFWGASRAVLVFFGCTPRVGDGWVERALQ